MRRGTIVAAVLLMVMSLAGADGRFALVMGNSRYENSPLVNPEKDAQAMEGALTELGFTVTPVYNGTLRDMVSALNTFKTNLRPGDTALFYYAGHGIQVAGLNYLIPVDALLESEEDIEFETLQLDRVVRTIENSGAATNIIILDSCRDNPFKGATRSLSRGLSSVNADRGSLVVYATAPGEVAQDGDGDNGIFTSALLKYITEPGLEVNRMLTKIRMEVSELTGGKQVPYASVSLLDEFYFNMEGVGESEMTSSQSGKFVLPLLPEGVSVSLNGVPYSDQLTVRGDLLVSGGISAGTHELAFSGDYVPENTEMTIKVKARETVNADILFPEYGRLNIRLPEKPVEYELSNHEGATPEKGPEMLLFPGTYLLTAAYADDLIKDTYSEELIIKPFETITRDLTGMDYSSEYKVKGLEEERSMIDRARESVATKRKFKKTLGWGFLGTGGALVIGSAVSYMLGSGAYDDYNSAETTADATAAREDMELYSTIFAGTLIGGAAALAGGGYFHLTAPNPMDMDEQMRIIDEQIRQLNETSK